MPVRARRTNGEATVKPDAEAWLIDRTADVLKDRGLIPILSIRGSGIVRVMPLDSVAFPSKPLASRLG